MHPSSFYDLQAHYIYTPLYGPYSLSEALEGLIFYSLNKSRDSILIDSKTTLWHELISELSNVIDDLQDYLVYFSSEFLIFPVLFTPPPIPTGLQDSSRTPVGLQ